MVEPLSAPASKVIVACPFPLVARTFVGVLGVVAGVTELLGAEAILSPTSLVAITVKV